MLRNVEDDTQPPRQVAVKRIKNHVETVELNAHLEPIINVKHATDEDLEMFFNEVRLMKRLKHPNLVEFVGTGTLREEDDDRELMFLVQVRAHLTPQVSASPLLTKTALRMQVSAFECKEDFHIWAYATRCTYDFIPI